ncbi:hypothetical protein GGR02_003549 [Anoxybacillus voinovskiensis]|uniref:Uncharacterized protein n=1 Tax=Anoxybacteroides voinovskiense TaxID=230470 RepID=A0A840DVV1_9BACL|nr:hypothetical protein [Anoxybacillus voinovskiensis]MBB4075695.1 hypothetical protein [Anoxybacillus voinovskiensis]GGJ81079.1 hypothetical protein GCM10008982_33170 [Anoxybacillus voinovskiensis]
MLEWFMAKMKREFGVEVNMEEVGYEAYAFDHEEIDDLLIPAEHVAKLPNPLLLEAFMYVDAEGNELGRVPVTPRRLSKIDRNRESHGSLFLFFSASNSI